MRISSNQYIANSCLKMSSSQPHSGTIVLHNVDNLTLTVIVSQILFPFCMTFDNYKKVSFYYNCSFLFRLFLFFSLWLILRFSNVVTPLQFHSSVSKCESPFFYLLWVSFLIFDSDHSICNQPLWLHYYLASTLSSLFFWKSK